MANMQTISVCYTRLIWARYRVYKYDRPDSLVQKPFSSAKTLFIPDWTTTATVCDVISEITPCMPCVYRGIFHRYQYQWVFFVTHPSVQSWCSVPVIWAHASCNLLRGSGIQFDTQIPLTVKRPQPLQIFFNA